MSFIKSNVVANLNVILSEGVLRRSLFDHLATRCLSGHDPRTGRRISFCALLVALIFAACGDDSTSAASSAPISDLGSNIEISSSEESSWSSVTDKDMSSNDVLTSSSLNVAVSSENLISVKSSSSYSGGGKMSSSDGTYVFSSSSSAFSGTVCEDDEEGYSTYISSENKFYICLNGFWIPVSSSSVAPSSSSKYYDMSNQFNAKLSYGEFTDPRDGRVYKTIRYEYGLGVDSLTFFAENLNYGKMIPGGTQQGDSTKYCYDDDPWYCENGFGGLYTWATAMAFPAACDSVPTGTDKCPNTIDMMSNPIPEYQNDSDLVIHQGICPKGWHIMNREEWGTVIEGCGPLEGGVYLGSVLWGGGNSRGFSLLPAGIFEFRANYEYDGLGKRSVHWLPGELQSDRLVGSCVHISNFEMNRNRGAGSGKLYGLSVRCVQDY